MKRISIIGCGGVGRRCCNYAGTLAGNWYPVNLKKEMQTYIRDNDLVNHVYMINAVPYSEVTEYYRKSKKDNHQELFEDY